MMIKMENGKEFFDVLKGLSNVFPQILFKINEEGMKCSMMDESRTMLVQLNFPAVCFSEYQVPSEENVLFDLEKLIKSKFKVNKDDKELVLNIDDSFINFEVKSKSGRVRKFKMRRVIEDIEFLDKDVKFDVDVFALIKYDVLKEVVGYSVDVEHLMICASKDKLVFREYEDASVYGVEVELVPGDENNDILEYRCVKDEVKSSYRIPLLRSIVKILGVSDYVVLEFSDSAPLIVNCDLMEGNGNIKLVLAPMIEV